METSFRCPCALSPRGKSSRFGAANLAKCLAIQRFDGSHPGCSAAKPSSTIPRSTRAGACFVRGRFVMSHMNGSMASVPFRPQLTILRTEQMGDHSSRPLLVVDGDSFAHRAYHGLPKSIRRRGNRGAGAIVGFANFLLRLYETELPRAVLVAWDTLDVPTYRHRAFAGYQSGRQFDPELLDQLDVLPNFVAACGFVFAKSPGYEADDFLAAAVADEERRGGTAIVATGDRDAFQLASQLTTILQPVRAGEMARIGPKEVRERYSVAPEQVPDFIALRGDPSDKLPGAPGVGPKGAAAQ